MKPKQDDKAKNKKKMTISGRQDLTPSSMYSLLYSFTSSLQLSNSYNHMDKAELILKNEVCMIMSYQNI